MKNLKNKSLNHYFLYVLSLGYLAAIYCSMKFLDKKIALSVMHFLRSSNILFAASARIPDILPQLVGIGTVAMWLAYYHLSRRLGHNEHLRFLQLAATALPVAFLFKAVLQFAFGRINPRIWLATGKSLQFNWFQGSGAGFGYFPSGHMTVFIAFGTAACYAYPRYRLPVVLGMIMIGMALIATDYHFLSDIIAGAYVGLLATYILRHLLNRWHVKELQ